MTHLHRNLILVGIWQAALLLLICWKWLPISPATTIKIFNVGWYVFIVAASAFMWWAAIAVPHHLGH